MISGIAADAQAFTSLIPLLVEPTVRRNGLVSDLGFSGTSAPDQPAAALDNAQAAAGAQPAPIAQTTEQPLALTGAESSRLALIGLWLVMVGFATLGVRRSWRLRDQRHADNR